MFCNLRFEWRLCIYWFFLKKNCFEMSEMWKRSISKHGSTEDHIITLHWLPQVRWIKSWKESVNSEWPTIPPYQQSNNKSRNPPLPPPANKTKQKQHTITSYQNTTTYDVGIPCPLLGQGHQCGGSKPIYWITNSHLLIIGCQTAIRIYVYKQYIKRMFFCSEYLTIIIYWLID